MHFSAERMVNWQRFSYNYQVQCLLLAYYPCFYGGGGGGVSVVELRTPGNERSMVLFQGVALHPVSC